MKKIRAFYKKNKRMIFVSHLDMNRYFIRLLKLSKLPIWYTEGFNKHPYLAFALPLSLGFESDYEVLDFKVSDDNISNKEILTCLQSKVVDGVEIFKIDEPKSKSSSITKAEYQITFKENFNTELLNNFLSKDEIIITKLTKKKKIKEVDISKMIYNYSFNGNVINITVAAGSNENLNPTAVLEEFEKSLETKLPFYKVKRVMLFDENNLPFV